MADPASLDLLTYTTQIVAAHLATAKMAPSDLPGLINDIYKALARADAPVPKEQLQKPAVPIKHSIHPDHLVCLEDGAKLQIMTRYLQRFGLTPHSYRSKWGLPNNYPMVAPGYAVKRSALARQIKLGTALSSATPATTDPSVEMPSEKRGAHHTASSVLASSSNADVASVLLQMEAGPPAKVTEEARRKLAAQQSVRVRNRSVNM